MGGVIDCVRRDRGLQGEDVHLALSLGSEATRTTSFFAGAAQGAWRGSLAADLFDTSGYVLVEPFQRGAVDVAAMSRHTALDATLRRGVAFVRASSYAESRRNGTPLTVNDTHLPQLAAGVQGPGRARLAVAAAAIHGSCAASLQAVARDGSH